MGLSDKYKEKKEHLEKQTLAFCLNMYLDRFYSGKEFGHFQWYLPCNNRPKTCFRIYVADVT